MRWIIRLYSHFPYISIRRRQEGINPPPMIPVGIIGTFDGAEQGGICGGGGTLTLAHNHFIQFWLGMGQGTNMKAELLALWALLRIAKDRHIEDLSILGDSKVIIDWARKKHFLQVNKIFGWSSRTEELISSFQHIQFQHIYRAHNVTADRLSKRGLRVAEGHIYLEETHVVGISFRMVCSGLVDGGKCLVLSFSVLSLMEIFYKEQGN